MSELALVSDDKTPASETPLVQRAHPDLGRLGVFWQTQGSGKSYSMAFFTEKVRRKVPGNFTFVIMTDREDMDDQIYRTYGGCGVINPKTTPRAGSGRELRTLLQASHSYVFTLVQKFNQDVEPEEPYSTRDDIIVISEAQGEVAEFKKWGVDIIPHRERMKKGFEVGEKVAKLVDLQAGLNVEERRAVEEGLSQDELAIFDLLKKQNLSKPQRESVKRASRQLLESVLAVIAARQDWNAKEPTKAEVEELILQEVFTLLPTPPFDEAEKMALAGRVYQHVWPQSCAGNFSTEAA